MNTTNDTVLGHKPGLFLLFFTEMWERFSYYGMRALLVLFLVSEITGGGWGWSRGEALALYGIYTGLVYVTPIFGGIMADKVLGYRGAIMLGALLMTLGHASMALETEWAFYLGLGLLILGNGFFKPNISTMVGQLYSDDQKKKDGAYTIFYMGINAGAFLGILLCGYIGEKVGWSYGFGLAGIFMFLGMLMFQLGQKIFGEVGKKGNLSAPPAQTPDKRTADSPTDTHTPAKVTRDRLIVIVILSVSTIFFWWAFEQAGGSMTIFAKDYTQRILTGNSAQIFFWTNTILTVVPLAVVTFVLLKLIAKTVKRVPLSNLSIGLSFVIIWGIAIWMLNKEFNMKAYEITFKADQEQEDGSIANVDLTRTIQWDKALETEQQIFVVDMEGKEGNGKLKLISQEKAEEYESEYTATVMREKSNETEVPASWFGILNSFFIIAFAPLFSKLWNRFPKLSAPFKFGLGLILLGIGFGILAIGTTGIELGAKSAAVSMWWLIFAYLLHTLGELCVSPVGLSYVSKLAPLKWVGLMFGIWFGATFVANTLAGVTGSFMDPILEEKGITFFFLIFTAIPIVAGLAMWALTKSIKRMMHGIH